MINTIIQGRMLVFVQQVNVLLYYVRKLPFVGEKIPYRLYGETDIKKANWYYTGLWFFRDRCILSVTFLVFFADD